MMLHQLKGQLCKHALIGSRCLHYDVSMNPAKVFIMCRLNTRLWMLLACWFIGSMQVGGSAIDANPGFHHAASTRWDLGITKLCTPDAPVRLHTQCVYPSHECTCTTSSASAFASTQWQLSTKHILVMVLASILKPSFLDIFREPPLRPPIF